MASCIIDVDVRRETNDLPVNIREIFIRPYIICCFLPEVSDLGIERQFICKISAYPEVEVVAVEFIIIYNTGTVNIIIREKCLDLVATSTHVNSVGESFSCTEEVVVVIRMRG